MTGIILGMLLGTWLSTLIAALEKTLNIRIRVGEHDLQRIREPYYFHRRGLRKWDRVVNFDANPDKVPAKQLIAYCLCRSFFLPTWWIWNERQRFILKIRRPCDKPYVGIETAHVFLRKRKIARYRKILYENVHFTWRAISTM